MEVFSERLWPDAGLRIDHLLLSPPLAKHLVAAGVDREVRGREHASDQHPPGLGLNATPGRARRPKWESLKMTSADPSNLERFVTAQAPVFETVLAELRAGRKRTHWMWFVFPQLSGLGRSSTARFYGISSPDEARAYLAHPILGSRLERCTRLVLETLESITSCDFRLARRSQVPVMHDPVLAGGGRAGQPVPPGSRSLVQRATR